MLRLAAALLVVFAGHAVSGQQPAETDYSMPEAIQEQTRENEREKWVEFSHTDHDAWETGGENVKHQFRVILPKQHRDSMPLLVILHSVGGVELGDRQFPWSPYHRLNEWGYQLVLNQTRGGNAGWWGQAEIKADPDAYASRHAADERRILSTVNWVAERYGIDRDRIYLSGVSMGGSGVLGNGMGRGDVFAAVQAIIPAGHLHFEVRTKTPSAEDPPPLIYLYSHGDVWARGHESVREHIAKHQIGVFAGWGMMGHSYYSPLFHEATVGLPWLEIRRDQAYPVFTNASTDDAYRTGDNPKAFAPVGQTNGYFRWRVIEDKPERFEIELWLADEEELGKASSVFGEQIAAYHQHLIDTLEKRPDHGPTTHHIRLLEPYMEFRAKRGPVISPKTSSVNIALRRLQAFDPSDNAVRWRLERNGESVQSGTTQAEKDRPLTIGRLTIAEQSARLILER